MSGIGVGLIGTGFMGKCHALAWTSVHTVFGDTPAVRPLMLCEVDEGLARRRADEFGFETPTADWRAVIANPAIDVVSITAPNAWHAPMAIAALEAIHTTEYYFWTGASANPKSDFSVICEPTLDLPPRDRDCNHVSRD